MTRKSSVGKTVYGLVENPKLAFPRVTCLRPDGEEEDECAGCGNMVKYEPPKGEVLISVCCCDECAHDAGYYPVRPVEVAPAPVEVEPEPQEEVKEEKPKPPPGPKKGNCPECDGPPRGRGWAHEEGCTKATGLKDPNRKPNKGPCPVCGGAPYKRGWIHTEGCSNSGTARAQRKAAKVKGKK